ncbi:MAG: MFS transporter [Verrucomicrobia bacterium]|nr:MFS transporter [Verrucomicrobiota bacterium]
MSNQPQAAAGPKPSVFEGVTVYHWLVLILASCGWLFDCMGQRIFVLAREPALRELLGATASDGDVKLWGGWATAVLLIGWGTGGILFGMMSDKYGRVKAMLATLVAYTVFSGLSGLARSGLEFLIYRFLCGMGVGGMFGAATTLLAESVPPRFRTMALGLMQALSACGNMLASALSLGITPGTENFWGRWSGWQVLFFVGVAPIILAVPILAILKEPEPWKKAKAEAATGGAAKKVGSIPDLVRHPRWRHNLIIGVCLGLAGMVGLWGIGFFSPELITTALKNRPIQASEFSKPGAVCIGLKESPNAAIVHLKALLSPDVVRRAEAWAAQPSAFPEELRVALLNDLNRLIQDGSLYEAEAFKSLSLKKGTQKLVQLVQSKGEKRDVVFLNRQLVEQVFPGAVAELLRTIDKSKGRGTFVQDIGSLLGMLTFTFIAARFSRRGAFLFAFLFAFVAVAGTFYGLKTEADIYWMLPLVGFGTLSCFAGYSIYFPEIFPTRLRGTGVGFCYNTVRYLTAPFPFLLGWLSTMMEFRTVAVLMTSIYFVGIIALLWAPETKGEPLPEDDSPLPSPAPSGRA